MRQIYAGLRTYRDVLMGIGILFVVLYHARIFTLVPLLHQCQRAFYGGVDLLLFCSGFGVAHSLQTNSRPLVFYRNRLRRLALSYYIFLLGYFIVRAILEKQLHTVTVLGSLTLTGWWLGLPAQINWFVYALPLFYLLAPLFFYLLRCRHRVLILFLLSVVFAGVCYLGTGHDALIVFVRLPLFFGGMLFGYTGATAKPAAPHKPSRIRIWIIGCVVGILIGGCCLYWAFQQDNEALMLNGLGWYPFWILAPCGSALAVLCFSALARLHLPPLRWLRRGFSVIGHSTFEIYLLHIPCFEYLHQRNVGNRAFWVLLVFAALLLGVIFHYTIEKLRVRFKATPHNSGARLA